MKYEVGDWVEVRSKAEILATLDKQGRLEELPFMPQMFEYCGQRFKVYKRAHKTCDTVYPIRGRRVLDTVHLDLRCDGVAYGGCQAACLIFWKTSWLKPVDDVRKSGGQSSTREQLYSIRSVGTTEADVTAGRFAGDPNDIDGPRYTCQATQLPVFTTELEWWEVRQYFEDFTSGNTTIGQMFRGFMYVACYNLIEAGIGV